MNNPINRRFLIFLGAGVALVAGLGLAWAFLLRTPASTAPPPASEGGLVVQTGRDDDLKLDPKRPLRCFVGGQFVGQLPLAVCAQRNGVATGALDVGLDPSGALAATNGVGVTVTPLAPGSEGREATVSPPGPDTNAVSTNTTLAPPPPGEGGAGGDPG